MNAIDTNVLIYRFDIGEIDKQPVASELLVRLAVEGKTVLLWQAAGELLNQLHHWKRTSKINPAEMRSYIDEVVAMFPLAMPTPAVLGRALNLSQRYSLSHWDSMLLAACQEAGVDTLYTEDMGAPREIDSLKLVNPF